jgi:hypothetical protein
MTAAYDLLAELAERELELVSAGAIDRLPSVHTQREALVASLPARPPAEARGALERAAATQARVTTALESRRQQLAAELDRVGKGRVALRGYAPPAGPRHTVDHTG